MKESVGGISLFAIAVVFIVIFTGYVSLSINYSKAYNVKNEIVSIIKNQGGICTSNASNCPNFVEQIADYFKEVKYYSKNKCGAGWYGFGKDGNRVGDSQPAAFCVKGIKASSNSELPNALYYQVRVFYQLDLPVLSTFFTFSVAGETARIYEPNECSESEAYSWCS